MEPHIRRWHTRYRVVGEQGNGVSLMENGVRERVAEPYAATLERTFAGDPTVYVLRRVHTELTVVSPTTAAEAQIAQRWAAQLVTGVVRTLTREADTTDQVMRFTDTAEYVARFLMDLLDGVAWERWYYGVFSVYRGLELNETIRRVLLDYADELTAILRRLAALGRLRPLLGQLSPDAVAHLWHAAVRRIPERSPDAFRIFLRTAVGLADTLELWTSARPAENDLVLRYFQTSPPEPDWKQPRALAEAVYAAFQFLHVTGWLDVNNAEVPARFDRRGAGLLEPLEWLDREWLAATLRAHFSSASTGSRAVLLSRPPTLSPWQRHVLELLLEQLEAGAITLLEPAPQAQANALALFAALASIQPALAANPATPALLEWLLARWAQARASVAGRAFPPAQQLAFEIAAILEHSEIRSGTAELEKRLSPKASAVKPNRPGPRSEAAVQTDLIECSCAGLFLLCRAILESRVTQMAAALGLALPAVLLAIAAEWTEVEPDAFDGGVLFWTGWEREGGSPSVQIHALDESVCEKLCASIERLLEDRAVFAPSLAPVRQPGATPLAAIAMHLLRLWAYWLPGFGQASAGYLLNQLIRRRGVLRVDSRQIAVSLRPAALDVVLQMAGYLKPITALPWLLDRRVTFTIDPALA